MRHSQDCLGPEVIQQSGHLADSARGSHQPCAIPASEAGMQQAPVADLEFLVLNPRQPTVRQRAQQVRLDDAQTFRWPTLQQAKE